MDIPSIAVITTPPKLIIPIKFKNIIPIFIVIIPAISLYKNNAEHTNIKRNPPSNPIRPMVCANVCISKIILEINCIGLLDKKIVAEYPPEADTLQKIVFGFVVEVILHITALLPLKLFLVTNNLAELKLRLVSK
jgi:hypothetical protein